MSELVVSSRVKRSTMTVASDRLMSASSRALAGVPPAMVSGSVAAVALRRRAFCSVKVRVWGAVGSVAW